MKETSTDKVFYTTVQVLDRAAKFLNPYIPGGMDYNKINVWLMYLAFASVGLNFVLAGLVAWLLFHA